MKLFNLIISTIMFVVTTTPVMAEALYGALTSNYNDFYGSRPKTSSGKVAYIISIHDDEKIDYAVDSVLILFHYDSDWKTAIAKLKNHRK